MAERPDPRDPHMDAADLHREEVYTDRKVGTIRVLTPVRPDGATDTARKTQYIGEAQMLTSVGALPISFEIEANGLAEAVEKYGAGAKQAFERAVRELQDMRRQAASSIVIPQAGAAPSGFGPGGGKIQMP
jgi:hypothetical protein